MSEGTKSFLGIPEQEGSENAAPLTMIECAACHNLGFSYMVYPEVEALLCEGSITRYCSQCGEKTMWSRIEIRPGSSSSVKLGPKSRAWNYESTPASHSAR